MNVPYEDIVKQNPLLRRGEVQCRICKKIIDVNSAECLQKGWPKCHGYTMTLDVEYNVPLTPRSI